MSKDQLTNAEMWRALAWIAASLTLGQFGRTLMQQGPINWRDCESREYTLSIR